MNKAATKRLGLVSIAIVVLLAAIPWLTGILAGGFTPPSLIAMPTAYQIRREIEQTAQASGNPNPTPEVTVFDVFQVTPDSPDAPAILDTPSPVPTPTPSNVTGAILKNNASTALLNSVALKHRPDAKDGEPVADISPSIPAGQAVALLGKAKGSNTDWWYRVVWTDGNGNTYVGWINAQATNFPQDKLAPLRPPPPCAQFKAYSVNRQAWTNPAEQSIVVLADVYRLETGMEYPDAIFSVTIDGAPNERSSRPVRATRGQSLLGRGTAINIGVVKPGSSIGFNVNTSSNESLLVSSIIFAVPDGCEFGSN